MKTKLIPCKTCEATIAKSAQKCPHCGASQQSLAVRSLLIGLLIVFALMIASMLGFIF
jgi:RNA polymerase subunit RPABC4/transcription elongation factor Spt4